MLSFSRVFGVFCAFPFCVGVFFPTICAAKVCMLKTLFAYSKSNYQTGKEAQ